MRARLKWPERPSDLWPMAIFVGLGLWAFGPMVATLVHVSQHGGVFTGVNGGDLFD